MTRSIVGRIQGGKVEIDAGEAPADGTPVVVSFEARATGVAPRLLPRGKYRAAQDLSAEDFKELRRQISSEWEKELDEFFPPRH